MRSPYPRPTQPKVCHEMAKIRAGMGRSLYEVQMRSRAQKRQIRSIIMSSPTDITQTDREFLRKCVELAQTALQDGDEPFGSLLVDANGEVLFEDRNRVKIGRASCRERGCGWCVGAGGR